MPIVVAKGLVKAYGTRTLLDGVDVSIHERERVGLVGDNGAGKSTLARILAGLEPADAGEVAVRRGAEIAYLAQEPELPQGSTAREAVLEGLGPWLAATARHAVVSALIGNGDGELSALVAEQAELDHTIERLGGWERGHEVDGVLEALGLGGVTAFCGTMSGGERRRVALARLLVSRPALAVLDEPTNHLDADAIDWLERYLAERFEGALILLTHDRWLLDRLVDRTLELERGKVYAYEGGWDAYLEGKAERVANEQRTEDNRRNFLRTELEWLRRSPAARTTKQRARVERAESALQSRAPAARRAAEFGLETTRVGKTILDARGLQVVAYGRTVVRSLDLALRKGERIGIVGPNGAGKTTLLRVLMGELPPTGGEVVRGENTRFAYLDQFRSGLDPDTSLEDAVGGGRRRVDFHGKTIDVRGYLGRFLFGQDDLRKKVAALSGGERARMALARLFLVPANVLVLDEPTNDLDVTTLSSLESMVVEGEMTALVVSHDRYFLDRVATAILELDGAGGATLYQGNWDTYRRLKAEIESARRDEAARVAETARREKAEKQAPAAAKSASRKGLTYAERIELGTIVDVIAGLEAELEGLEAVLSDPATYAGGRDPRETIDKRDALRRELDAKMERWMDLEARSQS